MTDNAPESGSLAAHQNTAPVGHVSQWSPEVVAVMRATLPDVAQSAVEAIVREVPAYSAAFAVGPESWINDAVVTALEGFLATAGRPGRGSHRHPRTLKAARSLGANEARAGRSVEALLAAYRVGARVAWERLSEMFLQAGAHGEDVRDFAARTFEYIDALSAASVAGHAEEGTRADRVRSQARVNHALNILRGARPAEIDESARAAGLASPPRVALAICHADRTSVLTARLPLQAIEVGEVAVGLGRNDWATIVIPNPQPQDLQRARAAAAAAQIRCLFTPSVPTSAAPGTWRMASRWLTLVAGSGTRDEAPPATGGPVELQDVLTDLVVHGDVTAAQALAHSALGPLDDFADATRERLIDTLRLWILLRGQRSLVAEHLGVHPQTVRYRMSQIRQALNTDLDDPDHVTNLLVATLVARHLREGS